MPLYRKTVHIAGIRPIEEADFCFFGGMNRSGSGPDTGGDGAPDSCAAYAFFLGNRINMQR